MLGAGRLFFYLAVTKSRSLMGNERRKKITHNSTSPTRSLIAAPMMLAMYCIRQIIVDRS